MFSKNPRLTPCSQHCSERTVNVCSSYGLLGVRSHGPLRKERLLCLWGSRGRSPALSGGHKKKPPAKSGRPCIGEDLPISDYGAYVIVRTPATLPIVIVVPCEKP